MPYDAEHTTIDLTDADALLALTEAAAAAADRYRVQATAALAGLVAPKGKPDPALMEAEQHAVHGLAWVATYAQALGELHAWAGRLKAEDKLREAERLILVIGFAEYLAQLSSGIPMSQTEFVRPIDLDGAAATGTLAADPAVAQLTTFGLKAALRTRLAELIAEGAYGDPGLDEDLQMMRDQMRRFVDDRIAPHAHEWHLQDALLPMPVIAEMAELGVFALTIPEAYGGLGLGKTAMCLVSEELSRGWICVGSLGTRSEIAAELIRLGGTEEQKQRYLPTIASGDILPTAVFTEPNTGSDLGSLKTRAAKQKSDAGEEVYVITGQKTWTTHGARSDLMTLLVRTDPEEKGYRGLSMLLAEKPRGDDDTMFPADGMSGGEIEVLGYRGMKEYEISFDGFEVPTDALLGGEEGKGFKQLMETFESARIQTAARAVGVAQNAMELGVRYAIDRQQFGKSLLAFPRVAGKLALMAVETQMARQLTYASARAKDSDRRCDVEAGMAKLLGARVAWANADNALQVHGGNGYALEYEISRVLCDARILNIFEGAAEIQAQIVSRGLLGRLN